MQSMWRAFAGIVAISWLVVAPGAAGATCGDDPGDAAAVAQVRADITDQCNCSFAAQTHALYVKCARGVVKAALMDHTLQARCIGPVMRCARQSIIGRPGVACCTTNAAGVTHARIRKSVAECLRHKGACVGYALNVCDACTASGCFIAPTPTPEPTATPTPDVCPPPVVPFPPGISTSLTLQDGSGDCGGRALNPPAAPPFSGEVDDVNGVKMADLGLGCLYSGLGNVPALAIPGGGTAAMNVIGTTGSQLVLAGSSGTGPADCTLGAGPELHCINGAAGTGDGACASDADCGKVAGSCAPDAHCTFGTPIDTSVAGSPACIINVLATDMCGTADLSSGNTILAATIAARVYGSACPVCSVGTCSAGANAGQACNGTGTSSLCAPDPQGFLLTLTVALSPLTSATSTLTETRNSFCPGPPPPTPSQPLVCPPIVVPPNAFGLLNAGTIRETGNGVLTGLNGTTLNVAVGATFCIPKTGGPLDPVVGLPMPGALSAKGSIDLINAIPLLGPLLGGNVP